MGSELKSRIENDLRDARRARDKLRTVVLTTTLSELRNREIEEGRDLSEGEAVSVIAKAVKQRRESAEQMADAGRSELAEKEEREAEILGEYLPEQLSDEEVRSLVREIVESGADQIGPVMGRLMPEIRGRFDGGRANRIVREELGLG